MTEPIKKKLYADGDVALTHATNRLLIDSICKHWGTDKPVLRTNICKVFGEDALFELDWTFGEAVVSTLVKYCSNARKVSDLVEALLEVACNDQFKFGPVTTLLGLGVIVPFAEAPRSTWKDIATERLNANSMTTFQGVFVNAFGTKAKMMGFVEDNFPDLSSKVEWVTIATAAASLLKLAVAQKKLGFLFEMAYESTTDNEIAAYLMFLSGSGVIGPR